MPLVRRFTFTKVTKGAVRYDELNDNGELAQSPDEYDVGGLYIRKHTFAGESYPQTITVSLEWN
jgi:hypothetical protein